MLLKNICMINKNNKPKYSLKSFGLLDRLSNGENPLVIVFYDNINKIFNNSTSI